MSLWGCHRLWGACRNFSWLDYYYRAHQTQARCPEYAVNLTRYAPRSHWEHLCIPITKTFCSSVHLVLLIFSPYTHPHPFCLRCSLFLPQLNCYFLWKPFPESPSIMSAFPMICLQNILDLLFITIVRGCVCVCVGGGCFLPVFPIAL